MRVSRICAWNTSRLAYDGSGAVLRDGKNHSLCSFSTGKRYHCDLSASYNIGARYFIRELLKPLPATERSLLEAKVPSVKRRTSCVYAALKSSISKNNSLKSAYTHEILRFTEGTFASSKDLSVAGRGFKSSRIKYLAPIL